MIKKIVFLFILLTILLSSCAPYIQEGEIDTIATIANDVYWRYKTGIDPTNTAIPVFTVTNQPVTNTPVNTFTESPTNTETLPSIATFTPLPTNTTIPTNTPTSIPSTNTPTLTQTSTFVVVATNTSIPTATPLPSSTLVPSGIVVAFPGAEGFGRNSVGGRGGVVYFITNLNNSGTGSLRACVDASGPRICIFRTGGTISLTSELVIRNPYITIAGQTAPGDGITIRHASGATFYTTVTIATHDVIMRYIAIRRGSGGGGDALGIYAEGVDKVYNVMIDHCSLSWGVDEVGNSWYAPHDYTIQWTIISEGLDCSTHPKGCHSNGWMLGSYAANNEKTIPGAYDLSFHHNLMAHNGSRTPLVKTAGLSSVVNNVIYNTDGTFSHVDMENQLVKVLADYINNYFKYGPDTDSGKEAIKMLHPESKGADVYVSEGNILERLDGKKYYGTQLGMIDPNVPPYLVSNQIGNSYVTTTSAERAYTDVLTDVGSNKGLNCNGQFFGRRDAHDWRIINDVLNKTGKIIDDESEVGGWLTLNAGSPCSDADNDGMPDGWESLYGDLSPNEDLDNDGYTNIEEYLNGTQP